MKRREEDFSAYPPELATYRGLMLLAVFIYSSWWFAVHWLLPSSVNPPLSRAAVCFFIFVNFLLACFTEFGKRHVLLLYQASVWAITAHFYYLVYLNSSDMNWLIGNYITVFAIMTAAHSARALFLYSAYVFTCSLILVLVAAPEMHPIFVPGILTIIFQANFSLRSKNKVLSDLGESRKKFLELFNSTFEGIAVHREGLIVDANNSLAEMFGYELHDIIGKRFADLIVSENFTHLQKRIHQTKQAVEAFGTKASGDLIPLEIRSRDLKMNKRDVHILALQDISIKKDIQKEKVKFEAALEAIRIRDDFIAIASHELKTPLTSIKIQTELLLRKILKGDASAFLPDNVKWFALHLDKQNDRLIKLVENILDVTSFSHGKITLQTESVDLRALIQDVLHSFKDQILLAKSEVIVQAPQSYFVRADRYRMEQVFTNLLSNALKYGLAKPIEIQLGANRYDAAISVIDHGMGIATDSLDRIFSRFERAVPAKHISGLGLGLYIAREIIEAHGGSLTVESTLGEGSKFLAKIPLFQQEYTHANI